MKNRINIITKGAVYLTGVAVVTVCGVFLPELAREEAISNPHAGPTYPFLIGAWVMTVPIFIALHQTLKLLKYIEENNAFSNKSVKALHTIRTCALAFGALVVIATVSMIVVSRAQDPSEDTPPIFMFGFIFTSVSVIIATFVAVLKKLLQDAIDIKSENELTV